MLLDSKPESDVCIERNVDQPRGGSEVLKRRLLVEDRQPAAPAVVESPAVDFGEDLRLSVIKGGLVRGSRFAFGLVAPEEASVERAVKWP